MFKNEVKIGTWVSKSSLGDATAIQTTRLRRAWTARKVYFQQVEQGRSKVALADLASLLEDSELRDVTTQFWKRYWLRFLADVHPSDAVVSRVSRELSKRMLCVFSVWKVRSLQFQMAAQRKGKLGEGLHRGGRDGGSRVGSRWPGAPHCLDVGATPSACLQASGVLTSVPESSTARLRPWVPLQNPWCLRRRPTPWWGPPPQEAGQLPPTHTQS